MVHARNRQENYNNLLNWANDVLNQDITNNHIEDIDITSAKMVYINIFLIVFKEILKLFKIMLQLMIQLNKNVFLN